MRKLSLVLMGSLCCLGIAGAQSAFAVPSELVANGGFESGGLGPWATSGLGTGTCPFAPQDWNVSPVSNTGCSAVANPLGSNFAAYVMNDGNAAGLTYRLFQDIIIPVGTTSGTLSFEDTSINNFDAGRTLSVSFYDAPGTTLLATVFSESTSSGSSTWEFHGVNVSAFLLTHAGQTVQLEFRNIIPNVWTGPAGLGLDNVSLQVVPEPSTALLLASGLLVLARKRRQSN